MNREEFFEAGTHFCNLNEEQIEETFIWEEIRNLPNDEFTQEALLKYSQYLVGNIEGTFEELLELSQRDRIYTLQIWAEITKDPDTLRNILHRVVHNLMK